MRKVKVFLILLVAAVCMFGCKGNLDVSYDENGGNNSLTPYATESELNEYKEGTDGNGLFFEKSNQIYQLWSAHVEER